jgi:hypothetical protein
MNSKKIIRLSIGFAFGAGLLSLCDNLLVKYHVHLSCAILWGLSLIALAILDKKSDSNSEEN